MFRGLTRINRRRILAMAALLLICIWLEYYVHIVCGKDTVYLHFFYVPIVLAALWWGLKGTVPISLFLAVTHSLSFFIVGSGMGLRSLMLVFTGLMIGAIADRRWRAEKALRESRRRFLDIALSSGDWIWEIDKDGRYTFVSEGVKTILSYEPSEVIDRSPFDLMPADGVEKVRKTFTAIASKEEPITDLENWNLTKEGKRVCLLTNGVPVLDVNGALIGYRGVDKDITQRKQTERALEESEERLQVIIGVVQAGIAIIDPETHRIVDVNMAATEMFGAPKNQIVGTLWHETMTTVECGQCPESDLDQTVSNTERELLRANGEVIPILSSVVRVKLSGREYLIESFVSIADRKKREEELSRNSKLESLGVLAGGIAHDFNNMLTGILGNISLARYDLGPECEAHELLKEAEKAAERASDLAKQLLTFAKGGDPVMQDASIEKLIRDSVSFVLRGSNIKAGFSFANNLCSVNIDTGQIGQVVHNLILNADQAMPDGGRIEIFGENIMIESGGNLPLESGQYVKIIFRDEGIGIPQEHLQSIFDPYFTTKRHGNGIGLSITYSIVKKHGGYIEVESQVGTGTTFRLYLPACNLEHPVKNGVEDMILTGNGRILVMDDEDFLRNLYYKTLNKYGYAVDCARDGTEVIKLYKRAMESEQTYRAVILDLTVPGGMGGKVAIKKLREINPGVKAIVCSGYSNDPVLANFKEYGFCGVVKKPFKSTELVKAVQAVLTDNEIPVSV